MKKRFNALKTAFLVAATLLLFAGCDGLTAAKINEYLQNNKYGSVKGSVICENSNDYSGITVSLVPTSGVISADLYQNELAATSARSAVTSSDRAVLASANIVQIKTDRDGQYTFTDVVPGIYTIYASMQNSTEKAVSTNIQVKADDTVTAETLKLTATGNISGIVTLDAASSGNLGFFVFVAGTGYLAITDDAGSFKISDLPAGKEYQLVIMKGNYTVAWTKITVNASETVNAGSKNILSSDMETGNNSLVWKGSFESSEVSELASPKTGWAYFNTTDGCSYIYDGTQWTLLARSGEKGKDGIDGIDGKDGRDGIDGTNGKDGTSITWLGEKASAPENPELYNAYYNTTDGCSYIWNGDEWNLLSKAGAKGADGKDGENGKDGRDGIDGKDGRDGVDGTNGTNGNDGRDGIDGLSIIWKGELDESPDEPQRNWAYFNTTDGCSYIYDGNKWNMLSRAGVDGINGTNGTNGIDGQNGNDGIGIIWKGELDEAPDEPQTNWAYYNSTDGCSYIYDGTQWTLLAKAGADGLNGTNGIDGTNGADGIGIIWKGELDEAPDEPERNWAYYNTTDGCSYIYDGTQWTLLAKAGADGLNGINGTNGIDGTNGKDGKDGRSLIWKGAFDSAPVNPELYWAYYNTNDGCSYLWNGTIWQLLAQGNLNIIWKGSLSAAPEAPEANWAYYNTNFCAIFVYDGTSWNKLPEPRNPNTTIEWLGSLNTAPANPAEYQAYYNSTNGNSYIFIEDEWQLLATSGTSGLNGETSQVITVDNFASYLDAQNGAGPFVITLTGELTSGKISVIKQALKDNNQKKVRLDLTRVTGLTSLPEKAFYSCSTLEAIALPNTITMIGEDAFWECINLNSITLPQTLEVLSEHLFYSCTSLSTLIIPYGVLSIEAGAFMNCTNLSSIQIPDSVKIIGNSVFQGCTSLTEIDIPDSVLSMGICVFKNCSFLTSVTLPNIPSAIGLEMFYNCTSLSSITIPQAVTIIGEEAFYSTAFTSFIIPDNVKYIEDRAFEKCKKLVNLVVPNSVVSIGDHVFDSCSSLVNISLGENIVSMGTQVFMNCSSLSSVILPSGVLEINGLFDGCSNLSSVTMGNNVTKIGSNSFRYCSSLTSITLPDTVYEIGSFAFQDCSSLQSFTVPEKVTLIDNYSFSGCTSLTSFTLNSNITTIEEYAFSQCKGLTTITIPHSVKKIEGNVFNGCTGLASIKVIGYTEAPSTWYSSWFNGCNSATIIWNYTED